MDTHRAGDDVINWCLKVGSFYDFDILLVSSGSVLMRGYFSFRGGYW